MIRKYMKHLRVFADPDETVRIWYGLDYEGTFLRYAAGDNIDSYRSSGPFVLLSDYLALRKKVYGDENGVATCQSIDEEND